EGQVDLAGLEILLERLDRRVMAARLESDRDGDAGEIGWGADFRIRRHEDSGRRDRVDVCVEPGVAPGSGDVDGPVTGAADVALASLLDALEGAFVRLVVVLAFAGADQLAEFIVEPLGAKIALLLGDPFLQPEMRFDHEFRHAFPPWRARAAQTALFL